MDFNFDAVNEQIKCYITKEFKEWILTYMK